MDWKSSIIFQLTTQKKHWHTYDEIIENYKRLIETNTNLRLHCTQLEQDVERLRLTNVGLERASEANRELANVNDKLSIANEELLKHLRDKSELAQEILRLNRALNDAQEKCLKEENSAQQYKIENEQLTQKVEKCEVEINELVHINEVLREEFLAVQTQYDQMQMEFSKVKPALLELQGQLEEQKRLNQQLEHELMETKSKQLEMLNAEVERFNKRLDHRKGSEASLQTELVSSGSISDTSSINGSPQQERRATTAGPAAFFDGLKRIFVPVATNPINSRLNQKLTFCVAASIPKREIYRWNCTELETYSLQFQPNGSMLATGGSDKYIRLWEIPTNGHAYPNGVLQGSPGAINALDFDNEGARLLAGCSGDKAYLWSYGDHRILKDTFTGHNGLIHSCKFHTGTKLVTGSADRLIKVWDLPRRGCIRTLFAGSKCHDLVITDAVGTIVSAHFDKKIRFWDTLSDQCRQELLCTAAVTSLSYNGEKQQLLACLRDDTIQLIDLRQNKPIFIFSNDNFQVAIDTHKAILSPDGRYVCSGSQDGSLIVWDATTGVCENALKKKHKTLVTSVAWHPEGKFVASCEKHREAILWSD